MEQGAGEGLCGVWRAEITGVGDGVIVESALRCVALRKSMWNELEGQWSTTTSTTATNDCPSRIDDTQ
jgi:hypothetical protein